MLPTPPPQGGSGALAGKVCGLGTITVRLSRCLGPPRQRPSVLEAAGPRSRGSRPVPRKASLPGVWAAVLSLCPREIVPSHVCPHLRFL